MGVGEGWGVGDGTGVWVGVEVGGSVGKGVEVGGTAVCVGAASFPPLQEEASEQISKLMIKTVIRYFVFTECSLDN